MLKSPKLVQDIEVHIR